MALPHFMQTGAGLLPFAVIGLVWACLVCPVRPEDIPPRYR